MPTRATIAIKDGDDINGIYCHFDGYYTGVGAKLLKHYDTVDKVRKLITLGDIASLGEKLDASWFVKRFGFGDYMLSKDNPLESIINNDSWLAEAKVFGVPDAVIQEIKDLQASPDNSYDHIAKYDYCSKYTLAYARDSGASLKITTYLTLGQLMQHSESYCYLFDVEKNIWTTQHYKGEFTPLTPEMCGMV